MNKIPTVEFPKRSKNKIIKEMQDKIYELSRGRLEIKEYGKSGKIYIYDWDFDELTTLPEDVYDILCVFDLQNLYDELKGDRKDEK